MIICAVAVPDGKVNFSASPASVSKVEESLKSEKSRRTPDDDTPTERDSEEDTEECSGATPADQSRRRKNERSAFLFREHGEGGYESYETSGERESTRRYCCRLDENL